MLTALNQGAIAWAVAALLLALAGMAVAWRVGRKAHAGRAAVRDAAPAERDLLTGLPTRVQFETALQGGLAAAEKSGADSCVLYIGVDGFRLVHDNHGSALADKVLAEIAGRLRTQCGGSTPMCRVAGDEFAIWLNAPRDAGEKLAHQLTEDFARTFSVEGREISIGLSVGLAIAPEHGTSMRLVGKAAAAMRSVKRSGGSGHAVFDPRIEAEQGEEATIAHELQQAIAEDASWSSSTSPGSTPTTCRSPPSRRCCAGAIPTLGPGQPGALHPDRRTHGLIDSIGSWVLESALKQAAAWRGSGLRLRVAVNVSGFQFRQDDFAAKLERGLKAHGLPPDGDDLRDQPSWWRSRTPRRRGSAFVKLRASWACTCRSTTSAPARPASPPLQRLHAHELKIDRAAIAAIGAQHGRAGWPSNAP